jgi:HlyD family secretion protein
MIRDELFRREALDKLRSLEQLDVLLVVDRPRHWLGLWVAAALLLGGLGWGLLGRVQVCDEHGCVERRPITWLWGGS